MASTSPKITAPSLERKRRRKLAADDPLRSPAKLLSMLDTAKDKLSAENDALAVEARHLRQQWQMRPRWRSAATLNQLIAENVKLKCQLCSELERCQHMANTQERQQQQQRHQQPHSSDESSDQQTLQPPADGGARGSDGDGASIADETSLATHSEAGADGEVTDEDIDAALGLFMEPSPPKSRKDCKKAQHTTQERGGAKRGRKRRQGENRAGE